MIFNPFADIYNKHKMLRSSLSEKIRDTILVFSGEPFRRDQLKLGFYDYLTLLIFSLNIHILKRLLYIYDHNWYTSIFTFPILLLSVTIYVMEIPLRFLVTSILTVISIPLVVLVHVISNELIRWDVKKEINATIQDCLDQGSNSLTIEDISPHLHKWSETRTNYLVDQLNNNSTITKLTVNYSSADTELLVQLGLKLTHITDLCISHMQVKKIDPQFIQQLPVEQEKAVVDPRKNLFKFLMENTKIDTLEVRFVELSNSSLNEFNQLMDQKEIKHLCKLSPQIISHENESKHINDTLEASVLLKSCFEFCKIMFTPWSAVRDDYGQINKDVIKIILMTLLQRCSKDILQKSTQGLIKSGFFSEQAVLIDFDPQQEEKLIDSVDNVI